MEYTSDQLNFFRLSYIVFDIVPEALREIFKQEWDALYKGTPGQWDDTPTSYTAFYNMESAKNQTRNKRLLGLMSSGDRNNWDCTCLFYAILYSDSVRPTLTPVVSNSVDEIREIRNEMAHNKTGKMSKAEFQKSIQKIKIAFSSLKIDITRIEEIENQTCFPTEDLARIQKELEDEKKRNAEPNSFCILPPHPSHETIYRKKDVDSIHEVMQ
ncbi:uncharacterized protein LOC110249531, partial [Exaiptasia diaphana]|uniref:DZIP3-like HEPN domain-containing protein n=1 Tax=Exaiptasia diaphana TaxID=2652724 RepID=A0A913YUC0_EXADI